MDENEKRKVSQLLKEKAEETTSDKVSWLYKTSRVDKEEYLLGRAVKDFKEFEDTDHAEKKPHEMVGAIFDDPIAAGHAQMDMQAKMREDPLFAIRKKQEDAKREILTNPVKMKKLQQKVEEIRKSKKGKKKKHKRKHPSNSDESSDEDAKILKKYLDIVKKKHKTHESNKHSSSNKNHKSLKDKNNSLRLKRHETNSISHRSCSRSRSRSPFKRQKHSDSSSSKRKYTCKSRSPSRSKSEEKQRKEITQHKQRSHSQKHSTSQRTQLTTEERDRKLEEMMKNAKWRKDLREDNVKRFEEQDDKEKDYMHKGTKEDFVNPMLSKHVSSSSLEDRLKRNIYNIQRTNVDLSKNFAKK